MNNVKIRLDEDGQVIWEPEIPLVFGHSKCITITLITHLVEARHDTPDTATDTGYILRPFSLMNSAAEWQMLSRTPSPRIPAGAMPASTASSVHGVNVKSSQRCRLSRR